MKASWVAPALLFAAGAVLGRIFGLSTLARGAVAVATFGNSLQSDRKSDHRAPARRVTHHRRRRAAPRRSRAA